MKILADNESLGCSQNPLNTPHTDYSPYFLIIKLPGTSRSVNWFHVTSCLAYIVVKLATPSRHKSLGSTQGSGKLCVAEHAL